MKRTVVCLSPFASAAVSEVSGGAAAVTARRILHLALLWFCDSAGDHQRETWRPVADRHSETQETAVRAPPTMTITGDHSPPPPQPTPGCHSRYHATTWTVPVMVTNDVHMNKPHVRKKSSPELCLMENVTRTPTVPEAEWKSGSMCDGLTGWTLTSERCCFSAGPYIRLILGLQ